MESQKKKEILVFFSKFPSQMISNTSLRYKNFLYKLNSETRMHENQTSATQGPPKMVLKESQNNLDRLATSLAVNNELNPMNSINYSYISPIIDETNIERFEEDSILNKFDNSKSRTTKIPRKKPDFIEDLIKLDKLRQAEKHKYSLEKKLNEVNSHIEGLKNSLILERPQQQNQVKKMIEISDDRSAAERAESLVRKLREDKKRRNEKKIQEMQKRDQEVKISIEDLKKDRIEKQEKLKIDKHHNIFERLDNHEKSKMNLVNSEINNAVFIKGLYKGSHYFKPIRADIKKNYIILPHIPRPQDLYSFKLTPSKVSQKLPEDKEDPKSHSKEKNPVAPKKQTKSPRKLKAFSKEYLAERLEKEEKILLEREKILQEEKKLIEARKKRFETTDKKKKIVKELEDIEKALFNYQSLRKYEQLSPPILVNSSQGEEKFLEYKKDLGGWDFGHLIGKSESPEIKKDFVIKRKPSRGIQAEDVF